MAFVTWCTAPPPTIPATSGRECARPEAGAKAPLLEAGLTKADVRALSHQLGLRTWNKPAMACLSSRFPYGARITEEGLSRVEQAENLLRLELGFGEVRVRDHGAVARIEVSGEEFPRLLGAETRERVVTFFKSLGYNYVTMDLSGFRSGGMNEVLTSAEPTRPVV